MKKIAVFAMTKKGYVVVKSIYFRHPGMIDAVIAARDPAIIDDYYDKIRIFCESKGVVFYDHKSIGVLKVDCALAVSWRWLINVEEAKLIVFHDSLLPRYRGFNPLVSALINGDDEIGVTALYAAKEYDCGEIIDSAKTSITYPITIQEAIDIIVLNYSSLSVKVTEYLSKDEYPVSYPQQENDVSYSLWRDEDDYFIDWSKDAEIIRRFVDAVGFPYKGAASKLDGEVVRIMRVTPLNDVTIENRVCGKIIFSNSHKPVVVCGKGLLRIDELVNESGSSMLPLSKFRLRFKGASQ